MKRVYCLTIFVLLLCLPIFLNAQLPKGVNVENGVGGGGDRQVQLVKFDGCNLTVRFRLVVFNLDYLNGFTLSNTKANTNVGQNFNLPEEYEPMFMQCTLNETVEVVEVESFSYSFSTLYENAFVFDHYMTIDISESCEQNTESNLQTYFASMYLITDPNGIGTSEGESSSNVYPICNYTGPNDIFECNSLTTSCPMTTCDNDDWAGWSDTFEYDCSDHCKKGPNLPDKNGSGGNADFKKGNSNSETRNDKKITTPPTVYPNPFQSELNIQWNTPSENSTVRIFNSNGQLIKSWFEESHQTNETLIIDTNELPTGIYFLQIVSGGKTLHHKLLKA